MAKKKKKTMTGTYLDTGVGLITTGVVVGSIPNISGTATETTLKTDFSTGLGHMGKALPTMGRMTGAGMVMSSVGGLRKKAKKFNIAGGREL